MEINVLIEADFSGLVTETGLSAIARTVLKAEKTGERIELGILITGQENIHRLNQIYRGKDRPTDVLSFYMVPEENDTPEFISPPDRITHLGEVVISYPQAEIQAKEQGHPVKTEIAILLVHGILHLLGYDHEKSGAEDKRQRDREIVIQGLLKLSGKM